MYSTMSLLVGLLTSNLTFRNEGDCLVFLSNSWTEGKVSVTRYVVKTNLSTLGKVRNHMYIYLYDSFNQSQTGSS